MQAQGIQPPLNSCHVITHKWHHGFSEVRVDMEIGTSVVTTPLINHIAILHSTAVPVHCDGVSKLSHSPLLLVS